MTFQQILFSFGKSITHFLGGQAEIICVSMACASQSEKLVAFSHIVTICLSRTSPTLYLTGRTEQLCGVRGPAPGSHMGGRAGTNWTKVKSPLGGHQVSPSAFPADYEHILPLLSYWTPSSPAARVYHSLMLSPAWEQPKPITFYHLSMGLN